jgi:16S rRNA U516 pseudouridylate synthase RsuA-like enzyme
VHEASGQTRGLAKESPRLSKLVSQLAQCSRREADEWIENGWVSVDGVVVNRLGARVNPKAKIKIKDIASAHTSESVSIVFNKPRDLPGPPAEAGREAIAALIRADNRWSDDPTPLTFQASHLRGLAQAGKLEADEGGMLAFTQEGSVARRLSGGDSRLEKEYHVRVEGELAADGLDLLRHGLSLDNVKLPRAQVSWLSDQQMRFVLPGRQEGADSADVRTGRPASHRHQARSYRQRLARQAAARAVALSARGRALLTPETPAAASARPPCLQPGQAAATICPDPAAHGERRVSAALRGPPAVLFKASTMLDTASTTGTLPPG